ncbi:D-inositol-3-phosphate glycosyltransferase [Haloglycomyces albus]|uniref:D-inositol-3-phosphate glycosyltransferase n=1 Tax=Haloglycomyces albus TaxID=526067 RepID=UPI00046CA1D8|nr:D-inositol-3-phosphate glycosyltransferase [Haloglycomyces albus]
MSPRRRHNTQLRRVALLSVHTSPLAQPGTGDAGGMNVYVLNTAKELSKRGVEVDIFTRATASTQPLSHRPMPGVTVYHVPAGPYEGLNKNDLPSQLCAFTAGVLRTEAHRPEHHWDLIHSHYWLSGQVGWVASERWGVPLVHTFHTLAKVKNASLSEDETPEPQARIIGEQQITDIATRLHANTCSEARELHSHYGADLQRIDIVPPGVNLDTYQPRTHDRIAATRRALGLDDHHIAIAFVGRIQPAKGPDTILKGIADLSRRRPELAGRLVPIFIGGPSNSDPYWLPKLAAELGLSDSAMFLDPRHGSALADLYGAVDMVAVPSHNESFGLVALEAQAGGTPVLATRTGGLTTAVADEYSGLLVDGHHPRRWANAIEALADNPSWRHRLGRGAREHSRGFSWSATAGKLIDSYGEMLRERAASRVMTSDRL